jgi:hypothetical protein
MEKYEEVVSKKTLESKYSIEILKVANDSDNSKKISQLLKKYFKAKSDIVDVDIDDVKDIFNYFVEQNEIFSKVTFNDKKISHIKARLEKFTKEELKKAIRNRANDSWINTDGLKFKKNFDSFFRNDEKIERYLSKDLIEDLTYIDKIKESYKIIKSFPNGLDIARKVFLGILRMSDSDNEFLDKSKSKIKDLYGQSFLDYLLICNKDLKNEFKKSGYNSFESKYGWEIATIYDK